MAEEKTDIASPSIEGPGKGKAFFDRAKTVAESGNFDYAIDMLIEGLNREPTNIAEHAALRQVALERKVRGGKPAKSLFGAKGPMKGKTPKDHMLNAEWLLAKEPGNLQHMLTFLRAARDAGYTDVIRWFGPTVRLANKSKPRKDLCLELAAMYSAIRDFGPAMDSMQDAMEIDPNDLGLQQQLKDLAAEATMMKAKFDSADTFKESLKDTERTKELVQEDALAKTREFRIKQAEAARLEYEAAPKDHRLVTKYATSLRAVEEPAWDAKAVELLQQAYAESKTYQYKRTIDEIRMRQFKREVTALQDQIKLAPDDAALKENLRSIQLEQLKFELDALHDWADHYPTDMTIMFQLGLRLYLTKRYDEAIQAFQAAQANPKHHIEAMYYLGLSFDQQKMLPEAADTLKRAVDEYELAETGNELAKRLYYALARVYEETDRKPEAIAIYSKLTQWQFNYRDARQRMATLRAQG